MYIYVVVHGKKETFLTCATTAHQAQEIALNNFCEYGVKCEVKRVLLLGDNLFTIRVEDMITKLENIIKLTYQDGVNSKARIRTKIKMLLETIKE